MPFKYEVWFDEKLRTKATLTILFGWQGCFVPCRRKKNKNKTWDFDCGRRKEKKVRRSS